MLRLLATLEKKSKKLSKNPKSSLTMKGLFSDLALTLVKSACGDLKRRGTTVTNQCCLEGVSEMCTLDPINHSECERSEDRNIKEACFNFNFCATKILKFVH